MDAYRGELDAARERLAATQAELAETRAERDRLAEAVRSRDDALAALRHKFDGAPSAERGRRLQRAAVGATVAAVVVAAFAFVTVRAADRRAAMAEMRASSRAAGASDGDGPALAGDLTKRIEELPASTWSRAMIHYVIEP